MKTVLNLAKDLIGATPETLARPLLWSRKVGKAGVRRKVSVNQVASEQARNSRDHLLKRLLGPRDLARI